MAKQPECHHRKPYTHNEIFAPPQAWVAADLCPCRWQLRWRPDDPMVLDSVLDRLDNGPGFVVLTEVPLQASAVDDPEKLALEIAGMIGAPLTQDTRGRLTCLMRDEGHVLLDGATRRVVDRTAKSSKSREALELHNDAAPRWFNHDVDVLLMLGVHEAAKGGDTVLASARTIYRVLQTEDPKAAATLRSTSFVFDRSSEDDRFPPSVSEGPVFSGYGENFAMRCNRVRIETAAWNNHRSLSPEQVNALDALDAVLARPELQVRFRLRSGHCLLLADRTVVHGRTAYRDEAGRGPGRCLVRVWVRRDLTWRAG